METVLLGCLASLSGEAVRHSDGSSTLFFLFFVFRCRPSCRSDRGDRRVQIFVSEAVCSRVRLRWPRHPARHPVSDLQYLQRQRPVSWSTLGLDKCSLAHYCIDKPSGRGFVRDATVGQLTLNKWQLLL